MILLEINESSLTPWLTSAKDINSFYWLICMPISNVKIITWSYQILNWYPISDFQHETRMWQNFFHTNLISSFI